MSRLINNSFLQVLRCVGSLLDTADGTATAGRSIAAAQNRQ